VEADTRTKGDETSGGTADNAVEAAQRAPLDGPSGARVQAAAEQAAIRRFGQKRHLPQRSVEAWLALGADAGRMLLGLSAALNLRTGQLAAVLDMLPEVALREGVSPAAVLARPEIKRIAAAPGSAPERASKLLAALRVLRYPRLSRALAKLQGQIEALRMPAGAAVMLPRELSSGQLVIELRVGSTTELDGALDALRQRRIQLALIFELLGGANEF
jgi:hypothetical protein